VVVLVWMIAAAHGASPGLIDEIVATRGQRNLDSAPAIERSAYERALGGEVVTGLVDVPGHKARLAWGVAVVKAPTDRFWAAVNDDRSKVAYTKLEHLELLSGEACGPSRVVFQYLGVSLLTDRWWVVQQRHNTGLASATEGRLREVSWKSVADQAAALTPSARTWADQGMAIPFTEGSWLVGDLGDGRTLVEYYAWSDPGGSVPARMASSFAAGGIEDTFASMTTLATKGPNCSY
jgi:hypothetical protein